MKSDDNPIADLFGVSTPNVTPPTPTVSPVVLNGQSGLDEARAFIRAHSDEGTRCPCCFQNVVLYKRPLNGPMAELLIWLVRRSEADPRWYKVREFPLIQDRRGGGDFAKLSHWALMEQKPNDNEAKRTSGIWRPTQKGIDFVHLKMKVPSHVHLLMNEVVGFSDTPTDIIDALGKNFSYKKLMSS